MQRSAFITGCHGTQITSDEHLFFQEARPLGLILFDRNIQNRQQIISLINSVKEAVGTDEFWVMIDQEGGRVQRLKPPLVCKIPPASLFEAIYQTDSARALEAIKRIGALVGSELKALGINVNAIPVLDVRQDEAHEIIGDRSYGTNPDIVTSLGRSYAEGHFMSGVCPVMKHIPGHGRANADSHHALPVVESHLEDLKAVDFVPFQKLAGYPMAMTAHILFTELDQAQPVTTSKIIIQDIIRDHIGFDGVLMSDDISMKALSGTLAERSSHSIAAGCDVVLHCNGELAEMREVAAHVPLLAGDALKRFEASFEVINGGAAFDKAEAITLLEKLNAEDLT